MTRHADVAVVGGGQTGLAADHHLRRKKLDFVILDAQSAPGGTWQHAWDSLHLFFPAAFSRCPAASCPPSRARSTRTPATSWTTWPITNSATTCPCNARSASSPYDGTVRGCG
jgi:cation diffusion facilitator CzcD-associated flavoprotein CzcO